MVEHELLQQEGKGVGSGSCWDLALVLELLVFFDELDHLVSFDVFQFEHGPDDHHRQPHPPVEYFQAGISLPSHLLHQTFKAFLRLNQVSVLAEFSH